MQIACKRFGCQKAVEVCYWTCKYRRKCKDWSGAVEGTPGLIAITERLEGAAAKSGRVFEAHTLLKPARMKRAAVSAALIAPVAKPIPKAELPIQKSNAKPEIAKAEPKISVTAVSVPLKKKKAVKQLAVKPVKVERKPMAKLPVEEEKISSQLNEDNTPARAVERKAAPKPVRPKAPADGPVYLLLSKNGKYRELREADLLKEAANIIKDSSLRLVKGQYLVPQITFKPFEE